MTDFLQKGFALWVNEQRGKLLVVQDTASGAHQSANAASQLLGNAEELQRLVRQFKL
jgi:hypothetical protein